MICAPPKGNLKDGKDYIIDCTVRLWNIGNGKEIKKFEGHNANIESVSFSPDGRYILSSGGSEIILWDIEKRGEIRRFANSGSFVSFSPDAHYAVYIVGNGIRLLEFDWEWEF